jgi:ParB family transcriptional regulator, chromosome partitioning protein
MTAKKKAGNTFDISSNSVLNSFVTDEKEGQGRGEYAPIANIILPKHQPRRYFDQQKLEELKSSIQKHGILEPLIVRYVENSQYELVAGERRYRAAKELGLEEIPVFIRVLTDKEAVQVALIENLQREDLNPVEETQGILHLLAIELDIKDVDEVKTLLYQMHNQTFDASHNVMASKVESVQGTFASLGKMGWESYVKNRLPLLKLPEELLQALEEGSIEYTKAKAIAGIKDTDKRASLLKEVISQNLSLSRIKEMIAEIKSTEKGLGSNTGKSLNYGQRLKDISVKAKKKKSWDDPEKQQEFELLLEKMERLL